MSLNILYEDKYLIALIKEAGILSQSNSENDLISALGYSAHIINRLDRPVGGIVLLAKDSESAARMTRLMQDSGISKHYLAVVCGDCPTEGDYIDYLMVNKRLNLAKPVNKGNVGAKQAHLSFKRLAENDGLSLVDVTLFTGRHHQIRVQLSHHGIPIWGDTKYNPEFKHAWGVLPALFAYSLDFTHPYTGEQIQLRAIPDYGKFTLFSKEIAQCNTTP
jgi:23S rRNA pseudouridine1911/1915/1917 synthase